MAPVTTFQQVPRHPWNRHCHRPWSEYLYYTTLFKGKIIVSKPVICNLVLKLYTRANPAIINVKVAQPDRPASRNGDGGKWKCDLSRGLYAFCNPIRQKDRSEIRSTIELLFTMNRLILRNSPIHSRDQYINTATNTFPIVNLYANKDFW